MPGQDPEQNQRMPSFSNLQRIRIRWGNFPWSGLAISLGIVGLAARFLIAFKTWGCNDIITWAFFGNAIRTTSLGHTYDTVEVFNHPPLMGYMASLADGLAARFHLRFDVLFKIPVILSEWIGAVLIYRSWRSRGPNYAALAFCLFAWNPTSIWVSAYHGNTDALCAMLGLLAALFMESDRPFLSGLALAGSVNVKLIAIPLIPVVFSFLRSRKDALSFVAALLAGGVPFLPYLIFHWPGFSAHVLRYSSFPGYWGATQFLVALKESPGWTALGSQLLWRYVATGKTIVLAVPLVLVVANLWKNGRWTPREMVAGAYCLFLLVTSGFGVQYLVYPVLALYAVSLRHAVIYSTFAGLYLTITYLAFWTRTGLMFSNFTNPFPNASQALAYLIWALLLHTAIDLFKTRMRPPELLRVDKADNAHCLK